MSEYMAQDAIKAVGNALDKAFALSQLHTRLADMQSAASAGYAEAFARSADCHDLAAACAQFKDGLCSTVREPHYLTEQRYTRAVTALRAVNPLLTPMTFTR